MSATEKSLQLLRYLPRISLRNLLRHPYTPPKPKFKRGQYAKGGRLNKLRSNSIQKGRYTPVGFEGGSTPFFKRCPIQDYYKDILHRRQHPPFSLHKLQLAIDSGKIDPNEPIDLATLCSSFLFYNDPLDNQYGVHLTDEGIDCFQATVNIEVQHASEHVIAAIERNGGVITTSYFDIKSCIALSNPLKFFQKGEPIPKRLLPPPDCIEYYSDPKNRGYLADPDKIAEERLILSQKYGYTLPDLIAHPKFDMLTMRKDPRQVFYGLLPGWVVNLRDKEILKPLSESLQEFYRS